jgi:murein DD-endopeptidase / murein LD-carboxypeptidase
MLYWVELYMLAMLKKEYFLYPKNLYMFILKKTVLLLSVATILFSLLCFSSTDPIDLLLKRITDLELKNKILEFKKGGYERGIQAESYDVEKIIKCAEAFLGTPHKMGGTTKKGIDCSGLVMVAHEECHISLPHDSNEQARYGTIVLSQKDLKRGDLVIFQGTYNTSKLGTHSGIYLGDNKFIHTSAQKGVIVNDINSQYWAGHFLFGTRLIIKN